MPNSTPNFMHIPLDFLGFCLVNIVEEGLLMPGKPNLGVFKYNEKYCVFADNDCIEKFIVDFILFQIFHFDILIKLLISFFHFHHNNLSNSISNFAILLFLFSNV
jgi:hypothetical protein